MAEDVLYGRTGPSLDELMSRPIPSAASLQSPPGFFERHPRFMAGLQMTVGGIQMVDGVLLGLGGAATVEVFGVGIPIALLGGTVATVGADNFATGLRSWNNGGRPEKTALGTGLDALGLPDPVARGIETSINVATGMPWRSVATGGAKIALSETAESAPISGFSPRGVNPAPGTRIIPEGVPDGWRIRPTDGKGGVRYYNPKNPNEEIRVMQGDPSSPYPNSQAPYARQRNAAGTYLREDGTPSPLPRGGLRDEDAHIPLDRFKVR